MTTETIITILSLLGTLCGGFAGVNASINGAQNAIAQQLYTNQISDLERSFAAQTANTQAIYGVQSSLAECCCENRAATADFVLRYVKDVDKELRGAELLYRVRDTIDWDLATIYDEQARSE